MRLWKNRPLFAVASIYMGASLCGFFLISSAKQAAAFSCFALSFLLAIGLVLYRLRTRRCPSGNAILALCAALAVSFALFSSHAAIDKTEAKVDTYAGQDCTVEAVVSEGRSSGGNMSTYTLEILTVNGAPVKYNALLTCYYVSDLQPGYKILMTAEAVSLHEAAGDIYETYTLMSDGIFGGFVSMSEADLIIVSETPPTLTHRLAQHRATLSLKMERLFGEKASGLPSALLLGERQHLTDEARRDFARTGVSHLLAISGLHMTLLFGSLALILKLFRLRPRSRAAILGILSTAYLIYLGFPPSATRAVIMLGMTYLASLCFASADPLTSLGLAGMGILLVSPVSVADVGFWMSFSATFGLLSVLSLTRSSDSPKPPMKRLLSVIGGLFAGLVAMTFSLWVTAPVMGEMSLLSAPMTLLLTPMTAILLILVPLSLLLSATSLGLLIAQAVSTISSLMTATVEFCARPSWVVVSLRHPAIPWVAAAMVLLTLLLLGLSLSKKKLVLLPMAAGWAVIALILFGQALVSEDELQVSYLVTSSTSEMLVMTHGQDAVICELSNGSHRAFLTAADEAASRGATEVAAVILTDYHTATSGALWQLFRRETVRALWLPEPTCEDDYYLMLACLEAASLTDTPAVIYGHGEALTLFSSATLTVERAMLERSVQPVLLLTLRTPQEQMTVCGRSILESDLALPALVGMIESNTVILSNKGPVLKQAMACPFGPNVTSIYFANKTVAAHLSPDCYPADTALVTVGQGRFKLYLTE